MATINSAYELRFQSIFKTTTDETWEIQIYDRKWSGAGLGTPPYNFKISDGGCVIKFDCEGDEKFAPIVGAKLMVNFMVDLDYVDSGYTGAHGDFIDDLLGISGNPYLPYEEGDIMCVVRKGPGASGSVLFCGEYLMDLDTLPDTPGMYPIQLTFTDGLGKLKEIPFQASNVDNTLTEYKYMGHMKFTYWIGQVLQHTKMYVNQQNPNAFWDDATNKVIFRTCVRWFNTDMHYSPTSTNGASDPLRQTKGTMKWADKYNPANQKRNIANAYDVLKQICRSWGMRVIYWNGTYHFTQIREFNEPNPTKLASYPSQWTLTVDQYSCRYYADGDGYGSMIASIGNMGYFRFFNKFWNIAAGGGGKIQKLEGCTYKFLPVLNEVTTDLIHEGFQNIFGGFPSPNAFGTNFIEFMSGPFLNSSQYKYQTDFVLEMTAGTHAIWATGYDLVQFPMRIVAFDDVPSPTLASDALATLTYDAAANSYGWDDTPTYSGTDLGSIINLVSADGPHAGGGASTVFKLLPDLKFPGYRDASTKYGVLVASPVYCEMQGSGVWINISTGSGYGSSAQATYSDPIDSGALTPPAWSVGLFNNFVSTIQPVATNNTTTNTIFVNSQTEDSHKLDWGKLYWGDGPEYWDDSALLVRTGSSTWDFSDWTSKDWARCDFTDSLPSADSGLNFVDLLNYEMKGCQAHTIRRATWEGVNSAISHFASNGKPYFLNPVGIIRDCDIDSFGTQMETRYFFRRGSFDVMNNLWEGEWIETRYGSPESNISRLAGGGNTRGTNVGSRYIGSGSYPQSRARVALFSSTVGITKDVAISSLAVSVNTGGTLDIGTKYNLKTGDKVYLVYPSGYRLEVALTADVATDATSISFTEITPAEDSHGLVNIQIPLLDMLEQGNRKTRGQIAGFDVSATSLSKGGVSIDGFIDSDTMEGASATSLATSESIKAYVDSSGGTTSNYTCQKCSGTTTTSATDGEAQAVVIPFDTSVTTSASTNISFLGSGGVEGVDDSGYVFTMNNGYYEIHWSVGSNTNIANNRILSGVKLQEGVVSGIEPAEQLMEWTDISPTHSYIYDRGNGSIRKGSTSNAILYRKTGETTKYYRLVIWKEESTNATTTAITLTNGTNIFIKEI
jgi:hypothetical protein